ncbi:MAG: hypothetical protein B6D36_02735 [Planctomycetes bacterium UTPLA1]|nr:MAG: hypothetical protein B6D36_02735 [Planctomycetes bacterium UTPLA1]
MEDYEFVFRVVIQVSRYLRIALRIKGPCKGRTILLVGPAHDIGNNNAVLHEFSRPGCGAPANREGIAPKLVAPQRIVLRSIQDAPHIHAGRMKGVKLLPILFSIGNNENLLLQLSRLINRQCTGPSENKRRNQT